MKQDYRRPLAREPRRPEWRRADLAGMARATFWTAVVIAVFVASYTFGPEVEPWLRDAGIGK